MTFERILRVIAGLSTLFGLGFALVPAAVFGPYGVSLDQSATFVARLFGAANIGFGIAIWLAAGRDRETQRAVGWGVIAYSLVEAIATILAISAGVANPLAWAFVVLDAVFIGACALLIRPTETIAAVTIGGAATRA